VQVALPLPKQAPPVQTSPLVQALPSLQGKPVLAWLQPWSGRHASTVQLLASSQLVAAPGRQVPPLHSSPAVQALLSLHAALLRLNWQPLSGSQLSSVQALPSLHATVAPAAHLPALHVSPLVQALPSLHGAVLAAVLQPPWASQVSVVQGLASSQGLGFCGLHTPLLHVSPKVQPL
jgi:hypothetical protein